MSTYIPPLEVLLRTKSRLDYFSGSPHPSDPNKPAPHNWAVMYFKYDAETATVLRNGKIQGGFFFSVPPNRHKVKVGFEVPGDENVASADYDYRTDLYPLPNPFDPSTNLGGIVGGVCCAGTSRRYGRPTDFEKKFQELPDIMNDRVSRFPLSVLLPFPNRVFFDALEEELRDGAFDLSFFYFRAQDLARPKLGGHHATCFTNMVRSIAFQHRCLSRIPRPGAPVELKVWAHMQDFGDMSGSEGELVGLDNNYRTAFGGIPGAPIPPPYKRLEAFSLEISPRIPGLGLIYTAHVEDIGDQPWVGERQWAGTIGLSKRLEAFRIRPHGDLAGQFRVRYRAANQIPRTYGYGDHVRTPYCFDGDVCGTTGRSQPLYAIEVSIVRR